MTSFNNLKFTANIKPRNQPPIVQRRSKLITRLWEQIQLAKCQLNGTELTVRRRKNIKDIDGVVKNVDLPKRIKPWWFVDQSGKVCVSVRYGSKVIELKKGMPSIQVNDPEELIETLEIIKCEVEKGSFDEEIEIASGALKANFKK